MARPLEAQGPLADLVRADGRPAYLIAAMCRIDSDTFRKMLTGKRPITPLYAARLASVLGCDTEDIYTPPTPTLLE